MERSSSSKAVRPRTAWFPIIVDVENSTKEFHIGWQYADGTVGLWSNVGKKSKTRPPWGFVIGCSFERMKNSQKEVWDYMVMQNRSYAKKPFKVTEMNEYAWEVNDFTSCVFKMKTDGRAKLLTLFFSLLPKSEHFSFHREGVYDEDGFKLDKTGVTKETLVENGGTLEEYKEFVMKALGCAIAVKSRSEVATKIVGGKKRKETDDVPLKAKRSREEKVADSKEEELDAPAGLEKEFHQKFLGRADIPLKNLKVSPQVSLPVSPLKVSLLANSMLSRFDPTQMSVMATPVPGSRFDAEHLEDNCYEVFHGRHRLEALKQLEKKGLLDKLLGMDRKMITCHIVRVTCPIQANYGALRGNELQSEFVRKPYLHELIFVLDGLRKHYNQEKCQETMMRYGKLLSFGADDLTAIRKFGIWSQDSLTELSSVLKLFETCQTEDAKELVKRKSSTIKKGNTLAIPNVLFRKLSKVDQVHFKEMAPRVRNKELSLKSLAENYGKVANRSLTRSLIQNEFGYKSWEEITLAFPNKFNEKILDSFGGAVISQKSKNSKGAALQDYCFSVSENIDAVPKVSYNEVENVGEIDFSGVTSCDTIVVNVKKVSKSLIQKLDSLKASNSLVSIILLLKSQSEQLEVSEELNTAARKRLFTPRKICFLKENPGVVEEFCENLSYGIVCPTAIYEPPLKDFNGPIKNLDMVVNQISPPNSTLAFINEGNLQITSIHSKHSCEYIGEKSPLSKFSKEFCIDTDRGDADEREFPMENVDKEGGKDGEDLSSSSNMFDVGGDPQGVAQKEGEVEKLAGRNKDKTKSRKNRSIAKMVEFSQFTESRIFGKEVKESIENKNEIEEVADFTLSIDEVLKLPVRGDDGKTMDEVLDELDIEIAERKRKHEEEMAKIETNVVAEKKKQEERRERMKENALLRDRVEAEISESVLRKMFHQNKEYLENIWNGKIKSCRHQAFQKSTMTRHALYYSMIISPFTDSQLDWTLDELGKVWMRSKREQMDNTEYVWKVILAECFIKFYMDHFGVEKEEAEKRISETPLPDDDVSSEDEL